MAILVSVANGNLTTATTWQVVQTATFQTLRATQETGTTVVTTALQASPNFTVATNTVVDAVLLKHNNTSSASASNVTVQIYNATTATVVAAVTVIGTDLPYSISSPNWFQFEFAASVTLLTANNYQIRVSSAVGNQHSFYRKSATAADWTFGLRTTTTGAPASGDILLVAAKLNAGGRTNYTVTNQNTSTALLLGNGTAGTAGIEVSQGCTLANAVAASTNYSLRVSNDFQFNAGSTFTCGTSGSPFPQTSTATFEINQPATGRFSWFIRSTVTNGITTITCYEDQTGKRSQAAALSANVAAAATSFTVSGSPTNWKNGDEVVLPTTERDYTQVEYRTMNANESAGTVSISAATTYAHSRYHDFWSQRSAMVANLTKCIRFQGTSTSLLVGNFTWGAFTNVDLRGVSFQYVGQIGTDSNIALNAFSITVTPTVRFEDVVIKDYSGGILTVTRNPSNWINYRITGARPLAINAYAYRLTALTQAYVGGPAFNVDLTNIYSYGGTGTLDGRIRIEPRITTDPNYWTFATGSQSSVVCYVNGLIATGTATPSSPFQIDGGTTTTAGKYMTINFDATVTGCSTFGSGSAIYYFGIGAGNYWSGAYAIKNALSGVTFEHSGPQQNAVTNIISQENTTNNLVIRNRASSYPLVLSNLYTGVSVTNPSTTVFQATTSTNAIVTVKDVVGVTDATATSFISPNATNEDNWYSSNVRLVFDFSQVTSSTLTFTKSQQEYPTMNWGYYLSPQSKFFVTDNSGNAWGYIPAGVYYKDAVNYYATSPSLVLDMGFYNGTTAYPAITSPQKLVVVPSGKKLRISCWVYITSSTGFPTGTLKVDYADNDVAGAYGTATTTTANAWTKLEIFGSAVTADSFMSANVSLSGNALSYGIIKISDWNVSIE